MDRVALIIPARMKATRLPGKPLADIAGEPMIVHVWRRAIEAGFSKVFVAAGEPEILDAILQAGGEGVLTEPELPSGSDRVWEAIQKIDPEGRFDIVVNIQGDVPTLDPAIIRRTFDAIRNDPSIDIATPVCPITDEAEKSNPNVVKVACGFAPGANTTRALYFSRNCIPSGDGPHYHHVGLYAWRRSALEKFVGWPQGILEKRESLEQLRALENHLRIEAVLVDTVPLGVDSPEDLERARVLLSNR